MHSRGFTSIILIPFMLILIGAAGYLWFQNSADGISEDEFIYNQQISGEGGMSWQYRRDAGWAFIGDPPECPEPLRFDAPVDLDLVSGILYPGQIRGTDYKPHGGFRFDNQLTNEVEVRAVIDGQLLKAAKYDDGYAVQKQIFYVNDCGIMVMHDHILELSPELEEALKDVPVGRNGDSRTTNIQQEIRIQKGDLIATKVGYEVFPGGKNDKNIFVDFGVYNLRETNGIEYDADFRQQHPNINEYGTYAVCWIDYLNPDEQDIIRSLPASGSEGAVSDYCK